MTEQLSALWKKLLSYTKTNWDIDDYPLQYKKQTDTTEQYNIGELRACWGILFYLLKKYGILFRNSKQPWSAPVALSVLQIWPGAEPNAPDAEKRVFLS